MRILSPEHRLPLPPLRRLALPLLLALSAAMGSQYERVNSVHFSFPFQDYSSSESEYPPQPNLEPSLPFIAPSCQSGQDSATVDMSASGPFGFTLDTGYVFQIGADKAEFFLDGTFGEFTSQFNAYDWGVAANPRRILSPGWEGIQFQGPDGRVYQLQIDRDRSTVVARLSIICNPDTTR